MRYQRPAIIAAILLVGLAWQFWGQKAPSHTLEGNWQLSGKLIVGGAPYEGTGLLRVMPNGNYISVFRGDNVFNITQGQIIIHDTKMDMNPLGGALMAGSIKSANDGYDFIMWGGTLHLRSATGPQEQLDLAAKMVAIPAKPDISDWLARAALWATFWEPDVQLHSVDLDEPTAEGFIGQKSTIDARFYSPSQKKTLLLARANANTISTIPTDWTPPSDDDDHSFVPIPLPILDFSEVVQAARQEGFKGSFSKTRLTGVHTRNGGIQIVWRATEANSDGYRFRCYDVVAGKSFDCRAQFGDPLAEYQALEKRAAAAMAAMRNRWAGGGGGSTSLTGMESNYAADSAAAAEYRRSEAMIRAQSVGDWGAAGRIGNGGCGTGDYNAYGC